METFGPRSLSPPASQPCVEARFVAVLHPGTRQAHALCWPLPPFSWRESPTSRLELVGFLLRDPRLETRWSASGVGPAPRGGSSEGAETPVPASGATRPGAVAPERGCAPASRKEGFLEVIQGKWGAGPGVFPPKFSSFRRGNQKARPHPLLVLVRFPMGEAPRLLHREEG